MRPAFTVATLLSLLSTGPQLAAQGLVQDLHPGSFSVPNSSYGGSWPHGFVTLGSRVLFTASEPQEGVAVWVSDGTAAGTVALRDGTGRGVQGSTYSTAVLGNVGFFAGSRAGFGGELWRTDGTPAGTFMVKDIWPGAPGSSPDQFVAAGIHVFFVARDAQGGQQLWRSDGTAAGTVRLAGVAPGPVWNDIGELTPLANQVVFRADDGVVGYELWVSNPTGATLLRDIAPGVPSSWPGQLRSVGPMVFFAADDGVSGQELWRTDGTPSGTAQVADLNPGPASSIGSPIWSRLATIGTDVLFAADNGAIGFELWKCSGTTISLVADILPGPGSSSPSQLTTVGTLLVFSANDGSGWEPWQSDGTPAGTRRIADINPGAGSSISGGPSERFVQLGNTVLIVAMAPGLGFELWRASLTSPGATLVRDIQPGNGNGFYLVPLGFGVLNGAVLFPANDGVSNLELWRSDGTPAGTSLVLDINPDWNSSTPRGVKSAGRQFLFSAYDAQGREPWRSDGTPAGTARIRDLMPGPGNSMVTEPASIGDTLLFGAQDGVHGVELWRTDGTPAGTSLVRDIGPGMADGLDPYGEGTIVATGGVVWFAADDGVTGSELWRSDGTPAGTVRVTDINPGVGSGVPPTEPQVVPVGNQVFFRGDDGTTGVQLWVSDGTAAGTRLVRVIGTGNGVDLLNSAVLGGQLLFAADDGVHGWELWRSDGTAAGTNLVRDIHPAGDSSPGGMFVIGNAVMFAAQDGTRGRELWRSDGTAAGTWLVSDINLGAGDGMRRGADDAMVAAGGWLFLAADDGAHGLELWRSDGTSTGTQLVVDLMPGPGDALSAGWRDLVAAGSGRLVLFGAASATTGTQLWVSDGTAAGTRLVPARSIPPMANLHASNFTPAGDQIFFSAYHPAAGVELWSVPLAVLRAHVAEVFGGACPGTAGRAPAIATTGAPVLGNTAFAVDLANARPSTAALLYYSRDTLTIPLGSCWFYLRPSLFVLPAATSAAGAASTSLPIPSDPALLGAQLYSQYVIVDPLGLLNLVALTPVAHLVIGG